MAHFRVRGLDTDCLPIHFDIMFFSPRRLNGGIGYWNCVHLSTVDLCPVGSRQIP